MKRYVVGLIFTPDFQHLLLEQKNRPDWQIGKLNGVGGKIHLGESDVAAMARECKEEYDLDIAEKDWALTARLTAPEWEVLFYGAVWPDSLSSATSVTDEPVAWYPVAPIPDTVIDNLRWIIPLTLNKLQAVDRLEVVTATHYA